LSDAVADTVLVPDPVEPDAGDVIDIVGGVVSDGGGVVGSDPEAACL
jgi:hypothetical protein